VTRRREFLKGTGAASLAWSGAAFAHADGATAGTPPPVVRPKRLRPGDRVGLVAPASANFRSVDIEIAQEVARAFSLEPRLGAHVRDRHGYLAGRDEDRAADVNAFFADPAVSAIFAIRGGWGCARILPYLDWDRIRRNPKVVAGYSDVTGLHCGLLARSGLVTFHAPTLLSDWPPFSVDLFRRVVFEGEALTMANPPGNGERLVQRDNRIRTITPGRARGRLLGGNLTVLTALLGSPYVPALEGAILFLEDVNEEIYRVDRMLTQLRLAGLLGRVRGFVFGSCSQCEPGEGYGSLTLEEVLDEHVKPLAIPAYEGAMIGHQDQQFTVPVGIEVELDAAAGTIQMREPAVL
jgi:muramoyltetrapeptide carboxypeptidase